MKKRKEIEFQRRNFRLEGRQDNVLYWIYTDPAPDGAGSPVYTVITHDTKGLGRSISTGGYRYFNLDAAKEFCQQIAAGEISLEDLRAQFVAEDQRRAQEEIWKEQEMIRATTERAKAFRDRLDAEGISYMTLLELEVLRHRLGEVGHNILMSWERGERLPPEQ